MWVLPTRSRVSNCQRFIKTWHDTKADSFVYVRLDDDDPDLDKLLALPWPDQFEITVGSRARIRVAMEEMFQKYPNESFYGFLADDVIPKTQHWDRRLIEVAAPSDISYANEVWEKQIRICFPCVGGDLVRFVGFFGLPVVDHWGVDTLWERLHHHFKRKNRQEDVILEHAHFNFNQSEIDQTYQDSQALKSKDRAAYDKWMSENFEQLTVKIQERFGW
jgi:hypothetical protein